MGSFAPLISVGEIVFASSNSDNSKVFGGAAPTGIPQYMMEEANNDTEIFSIGDFEGILDSIKYKNDNSKPLTEEEMEILEDGSKLVDPGIIRKGDFPLSDFINDFDFTNPAFELSYTERRHIDSNPVIMHDEASYQELIEAAKANPDQYDVTDEAIYEIEKSDSDDDWFLFN